MYAEEEARVRGDRRREREAKEQADRDVATLRREVRIALAQSQADRGDTSGDERSWALAMLRTQRVLGFEVLPEERQRRHALISARVSDSEASEVRSCGCSCLGVCTCRCHTGCVDQSHCPCVMPDESRFLVAMTTTFDRMRDGGQHLISPWGEEPGATMLLMSEQMRWVWALRKARWVLMAIKDEAAHALWWMQKFRQA